MRTISVLQTCTKLLPMYPLFGGSTVLGMGVEEQLSSPSVMPLRLIAQPEHCEKVMVTLTNTYGYLSCIFALSTPGTEQVYKMYRMCRICPK